MVRRGSKAGSIKPLGAAKAISGRQGGVRTFARPGSGVLARAGLSLGSARQIYGRQLHAARRLGPAFQGGMLTRGRVAAQHSKSTMAKQAFGSLVNRAAARAISEHRYLKRHPRPTSPAASKPRQVLAHPFGPASMKARRKR
jgi:succinate dehydrogenase/fumarate reductase flavoprotein subunit